MASRNGNLQHNAAFALYGLADSDDNIAAIVRHGGVQALQNCELLVQVRVVCACSLPWLRRPDHGIQLLQPAAPLSACGSWPPQPCDVCQAADGRAGTKGSALCVAPPALIVCQCYMLGQGTEPEPHGLRWMDSTHILCMQPSKVCVQKALTRMVPLVLFV